MAASYVQKVTILSLSKKAKLSAKPVNTLSDETPLIFNSGILRTEGDDIILVQKG